MALKKKSIVGEFQEDITLVVEQEESTKETVEEGDPGVYTEEPTTEVGEDEFRFTTHYIESIDGVTTKVSINDMGEEVTSYDKTQPEFWYVMGNNFEIVLDNNDDVIIAGPGSEIDVKITGNGNLIGDEFTKFNIDLSNKDNLVFIEWASGSEFVFNNFEKEDRIQLDDGSAQNYNIEYIGENSIVSIDGEEAVTIKGFHLTDDNLFIL